MSAVARELRQQATRLRRLADQLNAEADTIAAGSGSSRPSLRVIGAPMPETRHPRKVIQAKHVPTIEFLLAVAEVQERRGMWASRWDVGDLMPAVPERVVLAKANRLLDRKLITGCGCGCRGDFELTDTGREAITLGEENRPDA